MYWQRGNPLNRSLYGERPFGLFHITLLAIFVLGASISEGMAGSVRCTCPSVKADGKGNTSCSATETGNRCTIDFNEFGRHVEYQAAQALSNATNRSFAVVEFRRRNTYGRFSSLFSRQDRLLDQLAIYMAVSTVQVTDLRPSSSNVRRALKDMVEKLRNNGATIRRVFLSETSRTRHYAGSLNVSSGCIEVRVSGFWFMYKAAWSKAKSSPQCRVR